MITQHTAKAAVRKLTKSTGFTRATLKQLHDTQGGHDERDALHAKFCRRLDETKDAIHQTEAVASDLDVATAILKSNSPDRATTPVARLASLFVRLGGDGAGLAERVEHTASRAHAAAAVAAGKLDKAYHDVEATRAFGQYLETLAEHGPRHGKTMRLKRKYLAHKEVGK